MPIVQASSNLKMYDPFQLSLPLADVVCLDIFTDSDSSKNSASRTQKGALKPWEDSTSMENNLLISIFIFLARLLHFFLSRNLFENDFFCLIRFPTNYVIMTRREETFFLVGCNFLGWIPIPLKFQLTKITNLKNYSSSIPIN